MCLATFLYFAYGSNLLMKRIHINNPSAVRVGIGMLMNYRLDFNYKSLRWNGAAATIVPDEGSLVWGAIWELSTEHMKTLDDQEGVSAGVYRPITVQVETPSGEKVECRSYQLVDQPPSLGAEEKRPFERQPSKVYLETILEGAEESGLPGDYLEKLKGIKHNGYSGPVLHNLD